MFQRGKSVRISKGLVRDGNERTPNTDTESRQHGPEDKLRLVSSRMVHHVDVAYSIVDVCYGIDEAK
jgi:hypothetical protein